MTMIVYSLPPPPANLRRVDLERCVVEACPESSAFHYSRRAPTILAQVRLDRLIEVLLLSSCCENGLEVDEDAYESCLANNVLGKLVGRTS